MKIRFGTTFAAAILLFVFAVPARADIVLTPFVGSLFGGDLPNNKMAYGGSIAFMGAGIIGAEFEGTFAPKFIEQTSTTPEVHHANMMGNVIVGIPVGGTMGRGARPYATAGIGLFRTTAKESDFFDRISSNDFAYNLGGGVMGFVTDRVGIRGDIRYFQALRDDNSGGGLDFTKGDLSFWRWSVGAAFKF